VPFIEEANHYFLERGWAGGSNAPLFASIGERDLALDALTATFGVDGGPLRADERHRDDPS
jgi:hypothetical protein